MIKNFITKIKVKNSEAYAVYKACSKMPLESNEHHLMLTLGAYNPEIYNCQDHIKENPFIIFYVI